MAIRSMDQPSASGRLAEDGRDVRTAGSEVPSPPVMKRTPLRVASPPNETITYGGRTFICKPEMARIFLKRARSVIECGDTQLVPLLHSGGIELLLISRSTPYSLLDPDDL